MAHLTTEFPSSLSYGSGGGPTYRTTVVSAYSGKEEANQSWEYPRHAYSISLANRTETELQTLLTYYHACAGRFNTFNFLDPRDYKSTTISGTPANTDQTLHTATGGETTVQVIKNYSSGGTTQVRKITRPKSGTLLVAIDTVSKTSGADYTVNYNTGLITFTTGLATGEVVTAGYEFYTPCRFNSDDLDVAIQTANCDSGLIGSISADLVEIKESRRWRPAGKSPAKTQPSRDTRTMM